MIFSIRGGIAGWHGIKQPLHKRPVVPVCSEDVVVMTLSSLQDMIHQCTAVKDMMDLYLCS